MECMRFVTVGHVFKNSLAPNHRPSKFKTPAPRTIFGRVPIEPRRPRSFQPNPPPLSLQADKEKKVKKKKKEETAEAAPAPAAETRSSSKGSKSSSKKAKRSGSNVFSMFSQTQVAEFKEAFQLMDHDKDGIISKSDLRATFDDVGKLSNEKELDEMINEAPGPINFTQLLSLFALRMQDSGGSDDDEVVVAAFKSFDKDGVIDSESFRNALMTWGDKFTGKEVDDAFDAMEIDDNGMIDTAALITLLTGAEEEGEGGEAA